MQIHQIAGCIGCKTCIFTSPTDVIQFDKERKKAVIAYP